MNESQKKADKNFFEEYSKGEKLGKPLMDIPKADEFLEIIRKDKAIKRIINTLFWGLVIFNTTLKPEGREYLLNPKKRRFFFDREARTGMLEKSIFQLNLYFPNQEGTSLDFESAQAGRWVGYDFKRSEEFGKKADTFERKKSKGRLIVFDLPEIRDNKSSDYTPTTLLNLLDIEHFFYLEFANVSNLLNRGYIREARYKEVYTNVGLYNRFKTYLSLADLEDDPVYTVTPKGNGVVGLVKDSGDKVKKEERLGVLKPVFGLD